MILSIVSFVSFFLFFFFADAKKKKLLFQNISVYVPTYCMKSLRGGMNREELTEDVSPQTPLISSHLFRVLAYIPQDPEY